MAQSAVLLQPGVNERSITEAFVLEYNCNELDLVLESALLNSIAPLFDTVVVYCKGTLET